MNVQDEFNFWGRQITEHAAILASGLIDAGFKRMFAGHYQALWTAYEGRNLSSFLAAQDRFNASERLLLNHLNRGDWLGWIYPSLVEHMLMEDAFFRENLRADRSPEAVLRWWLLHDMQEEMTEAQLYDPSSVAAIDRAKVSANALMTLAAPAAPNVNAAIGAMQEILDRGALATPGNPRTIASPLLINHVTREIKRGLAVAKTFAGVDRIEFSVQPMLPINPDNSR